jgi:hypothetical protein
VVVAVAAVRMMKMSAHMVVCVIAVRNRRMAAAGPVNMSRLVPAAAMVGRAGVGVLVRHLNHMFVDMSFVRMVEMTIVQIVDVAAVADGGVATTRPMLVSMVGMSRRGTGCHGVISSLCPGSEDTAVRSSAAWSMALRSIGGKCSSARA